MALFITDGHLFCKAILRWALQTSHAFPLPKGLLSPHDSLKRPDFSHSQIGACVSLAFRNGLCGVATSFSSQTYVPESYFVPVTLQPQLFWANQFAQLSRRSNKTRPLPIKAIKNTFQLQLYSLQWNKTKFVCERTQAAASQNAALQLCYTETHLSALQLTAEIPEEGYT